MELLEELDAWHWRRAQDEALVMLCAWHTALWSRTTKLPPLAEVLAPYQDGYAPPTAEDERAATAANAALWNTALRLAHEQQAGG